MRAAGVGATALRWATRPWVWVVVALGVALTAGVALRYAPTFRVEHIDVLGNSQVSAAEVVAAAQLSNGAALLSLPVDEIESRVESLDAIAGARVVRDWPDRVKIVVRERRPVGYVESSVGAGLIGSDGMIYREQDQAPEDLPQLPVLTSATASMTGTASTPGTGRAGDSYSAAAGEVESAAFDVAVGLPRSLQRHVDTISASSVRSVQLVFADGVVVEWGSAGSGEEKATAVGALRQRDGWGSAFTVVDVSAPEVPALG